MNNTVTTLVKLGVTKELYIYSTVETCWVIHRQATTADHSTEGKHDSGSKYSEISWCTFAILRIWKSNGNLFSECPKVYR